MWQLIIEVLTCCINMRNNHQSSRWLAKLVIDIPTITSLQLSPRVKSYFYILPKFSLPYLKSWVYNVHCVDGNRLYPSASRFGLEGPSRRCSDKEWRHSANPWQLGAGVRSSPLGCDRASTCVKPALHCLLSSQPSRAPVSALPGMSNPGQYHRKKTKMA